MVNEFERRFARHRDELEWLFMELHDDRDALHRFEAMMREMWACREEELRALDRARAAACYDAALAIDCSHQGAILHKGLL